MLKPHSFRLNSGNKGILRWGAFVFCLVILSLFSSPVFAQDKKTFASKGPVVVTSSTLTADNKARTALFEGNVTAKTESMTIHSDKMLVHYSDGGNITKIDAEGNVKVLKGDRIITSAAAVYFAGEEKVVFTGQPRASEGGTVIHGTKITYYINEDRSVVENSRAFIENRDHK